VDQVVRLGRRSALERLAHLIMEVHERLQRTGLADRATLPWPLTQEAMADVLGLSIVHVNRTLQQLRREGLITLRAGRAVIPDVERLAALAGWEAAP
jgi:CRP-like cAMP-binding protein